MNDIPETQRDWNEYNEPLGLKSRDQVLEVFATDILVIATIATAWSGFQAKRWSGLQSTLYSEAIGLRVESVRASSSAERFRQIDLVLFTNWLQSYASGNQNLAEFFEKRFTPELKLVFESWIASDPVNNPDAPPGPFAMPEYHLNLSDESIELEDLTSSTFDQGKEANAVSDQYIFNTVVLASVLFLADITSRFSWPPARMAILIVALCILVYGLYNIATIPIL